MKKFVAYFNIHFTKLLSDFWATLFNIVGSSSVFFLKIKNSQFITSFLDYHVVGPPSFSDTDLCLKFPESLCLVGHL